MKKIYSAIITSAALLVSSAPAFAFTDVSTVDSNYEAIEAISQMGIINGYADGSYQPSKPITKAELSAIIAKCTPYDRFDAYNVHDYFDDVNPEHWAAQYISKAAVCGCYSTFETQPVSTKNTGSTAATFIHIESRIFEPDSYATYEDMVKAVITLQGYNILVEQKYSGEDKYIQCARDLGVLDGIGEFSYSEYATRGDTAHFVYNFLDVGQLQANVPSPDDDPTITMLREWGCSTRSEMFDKGEGPDDVEYVMYGDDYVIIPDNTLRNYRGYRG